MAKWSSLTKKQQKKFGGNKKAFKAAKKQIKSSGGNITRAKQVVKAHKQKSAPAPSPAPHVPHHLHLLLHLHRLHKEIKEQHHK